MNIVVENVQGNMFPTTQSNFEKTADQKSLMGDKSKEFRSKILMYQKNPDIKSNINQQMSIQMRLLKKKHPKTTQNLLKTLIMAVIKKSQVQHYQQFARPHPKLSKTRKKETPSRNHKGECYYRECKGGTPLQAR